MKSLENNIKRGKDSLKLKRNKMLMRRFGINYLRYTKKYSEKKDILKYKNN